MKGNVYQEIKTDKTFEFENTRSNVKKMLRLLKKMKIKFTNQGHLSINVTPDIGLKDEPILKYDVLVVANTFVDNCKQIATLSFKLFEKT